MNKHDRLFVDGVRKYESAIRNMPFKDLCNAQSVAQMRLDIRNLLDLIDRLDESDEKAQHPHPSAAGATEGN